MRTPAETGRAYEKARRGKFPAGALTTDSFFLRSHSQLDNNVKRAGAAFLDRNFSYTGGGTIH